ncbi:MAG TPA: hypothetical protein VEP90_16705 [Methylomirabilota bacterium]|nr:hypothetical protein [Methylomirabilota bacterium]
MAEVKTTETSTEAQPAKEQEVAGTLEKIVPKLCSSINFGIASNRMVIITLLYGENTAKPTVIERVAIDFEHAKSLSNVLKGVITQIDNQ